MKRRALLQSLAAVFAARPFAGLRLGAQAPALSEANIATLRALAEVVLPTSLDRAARERVVARFAAWARDYREGADRGHGYGSSTLAQPAGPSPAHQYPGQLAALEQLAAVSGAKSFAALHVSDRRVLVERVLNAPPIVQRLPARPAGVNVIADFMGFYFTSGDAWDLAYRADIGRDRCRTVDGSDRPPAPLR